MSIKGLTNSEVIKRIESGQVNFDTTAPSKSIKQIIFENSFTLFNFINVVLGIAVFLVGSYKNLLFLGVVILNTLISTIQEIRAKKTVDKLSVISETKVKVIRDGKKKEINVNEIVLDDIVSYELGNQVLVDSLVIAGDCEVNESFITGEAKTVYKRENDTLLSGSFIISGKVIAKVTHVGLDNYTSLISRDARIVKKDVSSEIVRTLNKIVKYVSVALIPVGILLLLKQFSIPYNTTSSAVVSVVAALIAMIPEGLILLVSTVLAISVLKLSKLNVLVQDLYAIETLARVDTLCLDKTGTLTKGNMQVNKIILLNDQTMDEIENILNILASNLKDKSPTFDAIKEKYNINKKIKYKKIISFSSERKYSGIEFEDYAYLIGSPEFILEDEYKKYKNKIEKYSSLNRVLLLAIKKRNKTSPLALILIKDKIRKEAINTINFFKENDCNIKVISGDNPLTISHVAKKAGIDIIGVYDASNLTRETNLNKVLEENNIFGRVSPNQKKLFIRTLKNNKHIVAMVGDGVNDVLALKEANCGIAMNDGTDAARNVSELVLLDNNFDSLPEVVKEGRKTINNVERSATLFLSKTIYASVLAVIFLFVKAAYPFEPIQMTLINFLTIGFPAFVLALEPNHERVKTGFLRNVVSKAFPGSITTVINVILLLILSNLFGLNKSVVSTFAVIITFYTAFLLIYKISKPLNFIRTTLLCLILIIFFLANVTSIGQDVFSLIILNNVEILMLSLLIIISTYIFLIADKVINNIILKKNKWFI